MHKQRLMGPLELFFRQFPWFRYCPRESASVQFNRLRKESGWKRNVKGRKAWKDYQTALVRQFNSSFAGGEDSLNAWHALLVHIGVTDPPPTVGLCKKLISGKFINLIDLINARDDPEMVIRDFPTKVALRKYTRKEGKAFPRSHEEAGGLLKYLFRHNENPDPNRRGPGRVSRGQEKEECRP